MREPWPSGASEGGSSASERLIEWTGERCVPWAPDYQTVYEHLHRYYFARRFCQGKRVLDLACGEGYGSAILAEVAAEVVGVDIDPPTIAHAAVSYPRENLRFVEAPMLSTEAYGPEPYDVVVCFEAIEHIEEHEELLAAIKAVLTESGVALISTPDRTVYTEAADYHNPFHVRELSRDEFTDLLLSQFRHVSVLGQRTVVGSRLDNLDDGKRDADEVFFVTPQSDGWVQAGAGAIPYLLAVASDLEEVVPESSSLIDLELRALRAAATAPPQEIAELRGQIGAMTREVEELREDRSRLEAQHYANDAQIGALEESVRTVVREAVEEREHAQRAYAELAATRDELVLQLEAERQNVHALATAVDAMRASRGWRVMEALRGIRAHARSLVGLVRPRSAPAPEPPAAAPPPPP